MTVVDASAVLDVLLRAPGSDRLEARLLAPGESLHAPHLLDVEVAQVLRRYESSGQIEGERGRRALADLAELPVERYGHEPLLDRVWQLRRNVTAYDAVYLALAEALGAPLVTRDTRLAAAPGHAAVVELL